MYRVCRRHIQNILTRPVRRRAPIQIQLFESVHAFRGQGTPRETARAKGDIQTLVETSYDYLVEEQSETNYCSNIVVLFSDSMN